MQIAEDHFRIGVMGAAALLMLLLGTMRFCGEFSLPGKPPRPAVSVAKARAISDSIKLSSAAYDIYLAKDVAAFGLRRVLVREMSAVFPYRNNQARRVLEVGESVKILGLQIGLSVGKVKGSRRSHMILKIENKGHMSLAYRVATKPSLGARACVRMQHLAHNAVVLAPGAIATRTECVYRKGWSLEILDVETVEVPELGYHYLSALSAEGLGLDPRTAKRHQVPHTVMSCPAPTSAATRNAIRSGSISWRDQIDFYARHRCKTYKFPHPYRAFRKAGQLTLPVGEGDL